MRRRPLCRYMALVDGPYKEGINQQAPRKGEKLGERKTEGKQMHVAAIWPSIVYDAVRATEHSDSSKLIRAA